MADSGGGYFLPARIGLGLQLCQFALELFDHRLHHRNLGPRGRESPVFAVKLGLRLAIQFEQRLLKKFDIRLQAGSPALHLLLDRADLHPPNVLGLRRRERGCDHTQAEA